jgi:hypothetical protein
MAKYPGKHFDRSEVKTESIVAELIDNSASKGNAQNITVYLMRDVENAEFCKEVETEGPPNFGTSFSISVVDDGDGFESVQKLHSDFKLTKLPDEEEEREEGEQGLFFVGMKEASLNKYHHFSMFARIDGEIHSRSIRFPGNEQDWLYEWKENPDDGNNPSPIIPQHLANHEWLQTKLQSDGWTTIAHASVARENLSEHAYSTDYHQSLDEFQESLSIFLGIVYRQSLKKEEFNLKIVRLNQEGIERVLTVKPVDLFLENWTPQKIIQHVDSLDNLSPDDIYIAKSIAGFGTLKGTTSPIEFDFKGGTVKVSFTPYLMPRPKIQKKLLALLGGEINGERMFIEGSDEELGFSQYSERLWKSENVQGFSFSRSGRTIVIGNHDKAENYGFYNLEELGFKMNFTKTRVRFHVEYEIDRYNDLAFKLFMNKNGYKKIVKRFFKIAMEKLKNSYIDGIQRKHNPPHNINAVFFETGTTPRHFHTAYTANISKPFSNDRLRNCTVPGCNSIHHGSTASDAESTCPKRSCKVCGRSQYSTDCTDTYCTYRCTIEECPSPVGHLEQNCPTLNCNRCGRNQENDCICCAVCNTPTTSNICLVCPCDVCGDNFADDGSCNCAPPEPEPPTVWEEEEPDQYGQISLTEFYSNNKSHSLAAIKGIMDKANLTKEDLIDYLEE